MKHRIILSIIILSTVFVGINSLSNNSKPPCVNVYIDFGPLQDSLTVIKCVNESNKTSALNILQDGGFKIEGTQKYGDGIVCRVDNFPGQNIDSCLSMPSEKLYWAIIIKRKSNIIDPFSKWGWAQTGIKDVYLNPGDSLGLVFTNNGKVRWPS